MGEEEVRIRPFTYVIGIICVILVVLFTGFLALFSAGGTLWDLTTESWSKTWICDIMFVMFWPLVFSSIASLIAKGGKRLSKHELTVIIGMVWVSWLIPTYFGVMHVVTWLGTARLITAYHEWTLEYGAVTNWMFGPDPMNENLWKSWLYGGPVPWGAWMPALVIAICKLVPFYLSYAFFASLWRRQWVDVEALPFPYATAASRLIDMAYRGREAGSKPLLPRNKYLWLGVLIGFLAILPLWGPAIPSLGLSKLMYPDMIGVDLTPYVIIPNAPLNFHFEAFFIGAAFLVPIRTLFSYIVTQLIVSYIWPPLMAYLGIWESHSAGAYGTTHGLVSLWRAWNGPRMQQWVLTWGARAWYGIGAGFALLFWPVFVVHREELINGIRAIFGKALPEVEKREPLKYKYLLIGWLICTFLYLVVWWYQSAGYLNFIVGFIIFFLTQLYYGMLRARAEAEFGIAIDTWNDNMWAHNWDTSCREWFVADPHSPFFIPDVKARYLVLRADVNWFANTVRAAPCATLMDVYKLASLQGVHSKYILLGTILAFIVGVPVALFWLLQMICTFGLLNLKPFDVTGAPNNYHQRGPTYACIEVIGDYYRGSFLPIATQYLGSVIGAITVIVVYILYTRYPGFPLNPAGVAMGWGMIPESMFIPAIVAYIVKRIIIRIGGARLYEERAVPFAIGLIAALSIAIILNNLSEAVSIMTMLGG